jgi:hypothetical protein
MRGSPSGMVGVGRSAGAGGGSRRRRGVRPIQGEIDQSNGSESFTRDQGRDVHEELKNGSPECPVHACRRRPKFGEVDLRLPVKFCRVRGLGKLHGHMAELTEALVRLGVTGVGWPRWPKLWRQWREERSSPELRRGVWPAMVSAG